ncbi:LysR family transcriptional regulator [Pseudomonas sp. NPDC089569]|uniref:LysR family transcriptional regulator n=1 Tax=Pseudomonas sp. NPDC089569 TaxID=3390722 RepID=UPI003D039D10
MNFRQLEHLVALAEEGSFVKASAKVHLTQSALTRSIQSLEDTLGVPLCDRQPRGIVMTPGGQLVLERARRALFELRALERDVQLFNNFELGELSFGIGPFPAATLLTETLAQLSGAHPGLKIRAEVEDWQMLLKHLREERYDFLVTTRQAIAPFPDLTILQLPPMPCGWCARSGHPLFEQQKHEVSLLRDFPLACVPVPDDAREAFRAFMRLEAAQSFSFDIECNNFQVLRDLALQSDVILFAPFSAVHNELRNGHLRRIVFEDASDVSTQFVITYLAHRTLSPIAQKAIDIIGACNLAQTDETRSLSDGGKGG